MSDPEFGEGGDRGLGDHDADDRARERQIRIWGVVGGAVLLAAVLVVIAIVVGRGDGDDTVARPTPTPTPTSSETTPATSETPVPPVEGTPVPTVSTPPAPSATPTGEPSAPGVSTPPSTGGQQASTDVFTPRLVWEPSTSAIEGAAVMGSIVEEGGSCTLIAERGGETVESAAFAAQADAQSTVCGGLTLSSERLGAGEWQVHVHYESRDAVGDSAPTTVTVG